MSHLITDGAERPASVSTAGRVAVVAGLIAVACTQPVLDLLGRNPEFFVAGRYERNQIIEFGFVVALVPLLVATSLLVLSRVAHPRAGRAVYVVLVALLGAVIGNLIARSLGADGTAVAVIAAVVGGSLAMLLQRVRPGRLLLQYLAVANVLFLAVFLVTSPTSRLLSSNAADEVLGEISVPPLPGPVVVVILDELPLTTLLKDDGTINAERFPGFAELAERSTWFRNASSRQTLTDVAVPTLLTGTVAEDDDLPDYHDHPRNLFTLFGQDAPVRRYELVTDLCPPEVCEPQPSQPLSTALEDALAVYGHRVLPDSVRDDLPAIDHAWGNFGDELGGGGDASADVEAAGHADEIDFAGKGAYARWKSLGLKEKSAPRQAEIMRERVQLIDPEPAVHLIHVALPHYPWILSPSGYRLMEYPRRVEDPADPAFDWSTRSAFQLQSMQTGAADVEVAGLIDHLDAIGAWDDTTLVVVADHGVSLLPPDFGRRLTAANEQELLRIPLFVHAPGLEPGVRDDPAQAVDLLPTLADLLDAKTSWEYDGHSLVDGSTASLDGLVGTAFDPALEVVARHHEQTPRGWDWRALAAVGEHGDLVGRPVGELEVGSPSRMSWTPDHEAELSTLPTAAGQAPQLLTGVVQSLDRPPELLAVVDDRIAGVIGGYQDTEGGWRFTSFLGPYLTAGAHRFEAYEVVGEGGDDLVLRRVE